MLVEERMTSPAITIGPDLGVQEALAMMRREKVRRFPVIDRHGNLIGIVSEKDLLNAAPSDATTLSVWEINYLLSKLTVDRVMTKDVITITRDTPIEEAARIMADNKVGGLPVVDSQTAGKGGKKVVGIVTETNLFRIFLELFGARAKGIRLSVLITNEPGTLNRLTGAVQSINGNIVALGTFLGENTGNGMVVLKVDGVAMEALKAAVAPTVVKILDVRET
ncbi:MAG: CBS domain-containing protein [Anaerolineaceae bacterium]|jgi:acetoin utilization protein AcuB